MFLQRQSAQAHACAASEKATKHGIEVLYNMVSITNND